MKKTIVKCTLLLALSLGITINASAANKHNVNSKQKYAGYLFAYFEGRGSKQEHLRFALSRDAKTWHALNGNQPIVASDSISTSGGIRDPHILRGEDGCFYIVATDMNVARYGWKENPGIVMLKSKDLIHWKHSKIVLKTDYAKHFSDAYWVWAPQTIYDRRAKKYMVYFTLQRTGDGRKSLITYYAYANADFTGFESEPRQLFAAKYGSIDNDIIYRRGTYHLFYKGNTKNAEGKEIKNGIQQATSKNLLGPWKEDFKYIDAYADTKTGVEGSGVFKLNNSDEYVMMYDVYGSGRYEYQTSRDLKTFTSKPQSFTKDFFPRHGTVCSLTEEEMQRLENQWGKKQISEKQMAAYLMVFHRDDTHSLYMALSRDGYHFTALNNARPVISGDTIAEQRGVRDPHIYRGPDSAFYLAATDLHIFAQREGKRTTEWERDGKTYGWGNNRGLVLMKSRDLINWTHTVVNINEMSPELADIGCAWAPETIYDEKTGRMMIYFTMRHKNGPNKLYYVYANNDFNRIETTPKLLFEYPDPKITAIDGDICYANGKYHLFYVAHDGTPGIKQATSDSINGGWQYDPTWCDPEPTACEAPTVWKRIGEEKWVLMYDHYGQKVHNFGFVETTDFKTFRPLGHFNEGTMFATNFDQPKHGAVVQITEEEAKRLEKKT